MLLDLRNRATRFHVVQECLVLSTGITKHLGARSLIPIALRAIVIAAAVPEFSPYRPINLIMPITEVKAGLTKCNPMPDLLHLDSNASLNIPVERLESIEL